MRAVKLGSPAGLDGLQFVDVDEPGGSGPGEIRVRLHASSLNFHDYAVATGVLPSEGRIVMSDGAGAAAAAIRTRWTTTCHLSRRAGRWLSIGKDRR